MKVQVTGKNVEVAETLKEYAREKLARLDRHLGDGTRVELELETERNPSIADSQIAEATIWTKGPTLRARETSGDMRASIDSLVDKLERQAQRYREKRRRHGDNHRIEPEGIPVVANEDEPRIVKTKQFAFKPMTPEEAVLQLELVGHDFFVFHNADSDELNVVYRRRDGNYGLIEPRV